MTKPSYIAVPLYVTFLTPLLLVACGGGGGGGSNPPNTSISTGVINASPTGKLNDTGITLCGDYSVNNTHNNNVSCALPTDADNDPIPNGQDAIFGRDVTHFDNSDGYAGFSFTKIGADGKALADQNATYATSPWSCVKDNVTGLIWEVKTDDGKLHDKDDGYTWHSTDNSTNGGFPGYKRPTLAIPGGLDNVCYDATITDEKKFCNTEAYVARVNTEGWCGSKNWRMPTRSELLSIAIYTDAQPSIDGSFFPNISQKLYWTSSSDDKGDVQTVSLFNVFFSSNLSKSSLGPSPNDGLPVMLVRSQ